MLQMLNFDHASHNGWNSRAFWIGTPDSYRLQISTVLRFTPASMLVNASAAAMVCSVLWISGLPVDLSDPQCLGLLAWALLSMVCSAHGLFGWWRRRSPRSVSIRTMMRVLRLFVAVSMLWALLPLLVTGDALEQHHMVLLCVLEGIMIAGAFVMASIPLAAYIHAVFLTGSGLLMLIQFPIGAVSIFLAFLGIFFAITAICAVRMFSQMYFSHFRDMKKNNEQGDFIHELAADHVVEEYLGEKRTHWLSCYDSLTGLSNRHTFLDNMGEHMRQPDKEKVLALVVIDIDNFTEINARFGETVGDCCLQALGKCLKSWNPCVLLTGRLSADAFGMVLKVPTEIFDEQFFQSLQVHLESVTMLELPGYALTFSVGVAVQQPKQINSYDLLRQADMALAHARQSGGHCTRYFQESMLHAYRRANAIKVALEEALKKDEFYLVFQPQVSACSGELRGFEALLRWSSKTLGTVSPDEFIPLAESCGLMGRIGSWVLQKACEVAQQWPEGLVLAINVSAQQLDDAEFAEKIRAQLTRPRGFQLELEVTETVLISDFESAARRLNDLRDAGCLIALDDFGTGYSSLGYLHHINFDLIKIDRSFIGNMLLKSEALVLVESILEMAKSLKMDTVAEGVEDSDIQSLLKAKGCKFLQGYLISKPLKSDDIDGWMKHGRV